MNIFKLSWKYLIFKPLNTTLNILLLALGLSVITVLFLMQNQFESKMTRGAEGVDLVVGAKGSPLQLVLSSVYHIDFPTGNIPLKDARGLTRNRLVKSAIPMGMGDNYQGFRIVGTNHDYLELYNAGLSEGEYWTKPFEVVLGAEVAKKLNLSLGSEFAGSHGIATASHDHDEHDYVVVGILKESGNVLDNLVLTSLESVWFSHAEEHDHVAMGAPVVTSGLPETDEEGVEITTLLIQYRNPMAAVQLPRFINSRTSMQAASPAFELNRLFELLGVGVTLVQGLAIAIIIIAGLSIFIALYNSMKERKYDLAVMRTLGASRGQLFFHIVLEGVILTFISACVGVLLGHFFVQILVSLNEQGAIAGISAWTFIEEELYIWAYAIGVGIVASLIPAWNAYRTDIATQLTK
ncbi:ABC transporter permease [Litoribacter ruber]|uniref:ABC transporter permease n=1 Tax=Litoribacter ruber TaxID=702568 RepID=UPI001BD973AD|nr:ABC transporter permease [Litoribacter ruber]MBT0811891.1 ABC transporter permease [Litoribacter ruber]